MEKSMLVYIEHYLSNAGLRLYDEDGQGLIEYVLIAALISIAAIASIVLVGPKISTMFGTVNTALT
jgi:pilus assembly protein Flp/PilA